MTSINLFLGDRIDFINSLFNAGEKAELIITSPPYRIGKRYEKRTSLNNFIVEQRETIKACMNILSETGSICWQVGTYIKDKSKNKEAFPLDIILYPIFKEFDLKLKNRITWHFEHGLNDKYRLSGRHETILWFTRNTDKYTFNLDPIRVPQKYPNKKSYSGINKGKLSGNPLGKNPGDVLIIPNVKSNHPEKTIHPCQFPISLVEMFVLGMTNENDLVVDPYIGSGSTAIAAIKNDRRIAGSDISKEYLEITEERIKAFLAGKLKIRPMNKPVLKY